jgi:hypothetical protein
VPENRYGDDQAKESRGETDAGQDNDQGRPDQHRQGVPGDGNQTEQHGRHGILLPVQHQWHSHHHYEYATVFQYHARTFCQPAGNYVRITAVLIRPQATAINIRDCGVINAIRSTWVHGIVSLSAVQDVQNTKATSEDMLDPAPPTDVFEECLTNDCIKFEKY